MTIKVRELPIVTVWHKPEETIRRVLDGKAFLGTETILGIYTIVVAIRIIRNDTLLSIDLGLAQVLWDILVSFIVAALLTQIEISAVTAIVRWIGKLIGGMGTWNEIKAVVAWNKLTFVTFYFVSFVIGFLFFPNDYVIHLDRLSIALLLAFIIIMLWRVVIYSRMISVAHQINVWRGVVLALTPLIILAAIISMLILISTAMQ